MGWRKKIVALRGAISVEENSRQEILLASRQLVENLLLANDVRPEEIVSVFFTATPDLNAEFPALALRELRKSFLPVLCAQEINVCTAPAGIIRVLLHVSSRKKPQRLVHLYLKRAATLRPDQEV